MSYADTKVQEATQAAGKVQHSRARRRLNPRCKDPKRDCADLECMMGYHVLERDARGPWVVGVRSMDKLWIWRRVHIESASLYWFELEGEQLALPNM